MERLVDGARGKSSRVVEWHIPFAFRKVRIGQDTPAGGNSFNLFLARLRCWRYFLPARTPPPKLVKKLPCKLSESRFSGSVSPSNVTKWFSDKSWLFTR